ncbi:hypothetical protein ACHAXA_008834 [Cyclostephanos tholiformis]|uniref:TLDc domain-containing protein n=1 Tax=Cyclostephanos tholiformis TaxID=382380 RepID=A0ABD3R1P8_9STRA
MDKLHIASKSLNHAQLEYERDYNEQIFAFSQRESRLQDCMSQLISKKEEIAETNGNRDATDDDLVEVNAGGEIVVAKRSTLTQIQGTKFEAIFSGRWDKKLLRDSHGRIFLDVNPTCFRAIIDHLNEMLISSRDSPPSPPSVDGERKHLLQHQLDLFGIVPKVEIPESAILNDEGQCMVLFGFVPTVEMPNSTIIKHNGHCKILHDWLKEDGLDGEFILLYQGSRNGLSGQAFHSNCDNKGCTLTIIKTTCGRVIGGYSNTPWTSSQNCYDVADKAFLFALSGSSVLSPCKMLKDENNTCAIRNHPKLL